MKIPHLREFIVFFSAFLFVFTYSGCNRAIDGIAVETNVVIHDQTDHRPSHRGRNHARHYGQP